MEQLKKKMRVIVEDDDDARKERKTVNEERSTSDTEAHKAALLLLSITFPKPALGVITRNWMADFHHLLRPARSWRTYTIEHRLRQLCGYF